MLTKIDASLMKVYFSPRSKQENAKVNKLDVEDKMVFDVTFVKDRLKLKVS